MRESLKKLRNRIVQSILILLLAFLVSCEINKKKVASKIERVKEAYPISLNPLISLDQDSTIIDLNDFFSKGDQIEISRIPEGLNYSKEDSTTIVFSGEMKNKLDYFSIISKGEKQDIPIRKNHLLINENLEEKPFITTIGNREEWKVVADQEVVFLTFYNNQFISISKGNELVGKVPRGMPSIKNASIRIFAYNENGTANDLLIPLHEGDPIVKPQDLSFNDPHQYILYSILVDRFKNGDLANDNPVGEPEVKPEVDFQGGDLRGVIQKVKEGYFENLGVNGIVLSPIIQNPDEGYGILNTDYIRTKFAGYNGKWPLFFSKIDKRFGRQEDLVELIEEAHKRNLVVLTSYIADRVHKNHPLVTKHSDWFIKREVEKKRNTLKGTELDKDKVLLDFSNPEVVNLVTDSITYWLKKYNVDGIVYESASNKQEILLKTLNEKLREEKLIFTDRNIFQFNEIQRKGYKKSKFLNGEKDNSLHNFLKNLVIQNGDSINEFKALLEKNIYKNGAHPFSGNYSGSINEARMASEGDGSFSKTEDFQKIAWIKKIKNKNEIGFRKIALLSAFNTTLLGIPIFYQGDEIGMPGAEAPDNQRMMEFDNENISDNRPWVFKARKKLKEDISKLTYLRQNNMAFLYGDMKILYLSDGGIAYMNQYMNNTTITVLNTLAKPKTFLIELPKFTTYRNLREKFNHNYKIIGNQLEITLESHSFEVLVQN